MPVIFWLILLGVAGWVWVSIGDHPGDTLSKCLRQTEPVLLVRQLKLYEARGWGSSPQDQLHNCVTNEAFTTAFCKALYLDANHLVGDCMRDAGYWFEDADLHLYYGHSPYKNGSLNFHGDDEIAEVCDSPEYEKPECYHQRVRFVLNHPWTWSGETKERAATMKARRAVQ